MRFCAFRVPDMDNFEQIIQCMQSHSADLVPECRAIVQNISDDIAAFHTACDTDMQAKCPDAIGQPMKTHECIIVNLADLSHGCLAEISTIAQKMEKHAGPHGPPPRGVMDAYPGLFGQFQAGGEPHQGTMFMNNDEDRQGKHHGFIGSFMFGAVVSALVVGSVLFVKKVMKKRRGCCRHGCKPALQHPPFPGVWMEGHQPVGAPILAQTADKNADSYHQFA